MLSRKMAVIGISAFVVLMAIGLFPGAGAFKNTTNISASSSCTVVWTLPTGTYGLGSTVSAMASTTCKGTGTWMICYGSASPPFIPCTTSTAAAYGTFSCNGVSCTTLFSYTAGKAPLTVGMYSVWTSFKGTSSQSSWGISNLTVTPQFPAGIILAVLAPVAGLIGYAKFRKPTLKV